MNHRSTTLHSLFLILTVGVPVHAGRPTLVELKTGDGIYRGRVECKNKFNCWLMDRDGKLNGLRLNHVKKFRTVSSTFSPYSMPELKSQLSKELGKDFKIASDGQYIVCGSPQRARDYAELFDDTYRSFRNYFSRKGFQLPKPEFPLVAIVFPDFSSYADYQRREGLSPSRGILGYYMRSSNRVALYETNSSAISLDDSHSGQKNPVVQNKSLEIIFTNSRDVKKTRGFLSQSGFGNQQAEISELSVPVARISKASKSPEATIIHEATHQIAFNTGLHSRVGETPKWIVEGLATVFEVPGIRDTKSTVKAMHRVNRDRYLWFRDYISKRRKEKSLLEFISSDQKFRIGNSQVLLDAYSEAWALSFFLLETRPVKYARYLRKIAEKKGDSAYPAKERVKDFQSIFGNGTAKLEIDFIRYLERL